MTDRPMTRDEHLEMIRVTGMQTRHGLSGFLLSCGAPNCAEAEIFAPGFTMAAVVAAVDAHVDEVAPCAKTAHHRAHRWVQLPGQWRTCEGIR